MPTATQILLKSWRLFALLALFIASFYFAWGNFCFWVGYGLLMLSDPRCRYEMAQPVGPMTIMLGLFIPAGLSIYVAIRNFEHPFYPIVLSLMFVGVIACIFVRREEMKQARWAREREEEERLKKE